MREEDYRRLIWLCTRDNQVHKLATLILVIAMCLLGMASYCSDRYYDHDITDQYGSIKVAKIISSKCMVPKPDVIDFWLDVPFNVVNDGHLVLARPKDAAIAPVHPTLYQRLYVIVPNEDEAIEVRNITDLRGYIKIDTTAEALAFSRLLTSPRTYYCFQRKADSAEVVSRDQVDLGFCFGDKKQREHLRKTSSGYFGIISSKQILVKLGLQQATVQVTHGGYEIHRSLLMQYLETIPSCSLVDIVEFVGHDGYYVRMSTKERDLPKESGIEWLLPLSQYHLKIHSTNQPSIYCGITEKHE